VKSRNRMPLWQYEYYLSMFPTPMKSSFLVLFLSGVIMSLSLEIMQADICLMVISIEVIKKNTTLPPAQFM